MTDVRKDLEFKLPLHHRQTWSLLSALMIFFLTSTLLFHMQAIAQEGDGRPVHPSKKRFYAPEIWKESIPALPPATNATRFIAVEVSDMGESVLKVDPSTVSVGSDFVVRLALVVISSQGHANILYEGYRCDTSEYKSYAMRIGFDSGWTGFRNPQWRSVRRQGKKNYRADLLDHYLCPAVHYSERQREILDALGTAKIKKNDRRIYR